MCRYDGIHTFVTPATAVVQLKSFLYWMPSLCHCAGQAFDGMTLKILMQGFYSFYLMAVSKNHSLEAQVLVKMILSSYR